MERVDDFSAAPPGESCRLLARTVDGVKASTQVRPGIINNTFVLIVSDAKPYLNMKVSLAPRTYIRQPDYWEIEVIGCLSGIGLPAISTYHDFLWLDHIRGLKGIEVLWAHGEKERIDVP